MNWSKINIRDHHHLRYNKERLILEHYDIKVPVRQKFSAIPKKDHLILVLFQSSLLIVLVVNFCTLSEIHAPAACPNLSLIRI